MAKMMTFDEWWEENRKEFAKQYVAFGALTFMEIARKSWEAGVEAADD